jgi:hypothetical protein
MRNIRILKLVLCLNKIICGDFIPLAGRIIKTQLSSRRSFGDLLTLPSFVIRIFYVLSDLVIYYRKQGRAMQ